MTHDIDKQIEEQEEPTASQVHDWNSAIFGPAYAWALWRQRTPTFLALPTQPGMYNPSHLLGPLYEEDDVKAGGGNDLTLGMDWKSEHDDNWLRVDAVVDSGAAKPVAPPHMAPSHAVRSSAGSSSGKALSAANGSPLLNIGKQHLSMVTDDGLETSVLFQL